MRRKGGGRARQPRRHLRPEARAGKYRYLRAKESDEPLRRHTPTRRVRPEDDAKLTRRNTEGGAASRATALSAAPGRVCRDHLCQHFRRFEVTFRTADSVAKEGDVEES